MKDDAAGPSVRLGGKMSAGAPTYPVTTIAKLLMLSERRVQQLTAEGVIPKSERGRYELAPAVQGYIRFLQERTMGNNEKMPIDYHVEKARLTKAQADAAELDFARAKGEIAPIKEFERVQAARYAVIRTNIMNVPQRAVLQLLGETDETLFKQKLRAELMLALETAAADPLEIAEDDEQIGE